MINIKEEKLFINTISPYFRVCFQLAEGEPYYQQEDGEEEALIFRPDYVKQAVATALKIFAACSFSSNITLVYEHFIGDSDVSASKTCIESCINYTSSTYFSFKHKEEKDNEVYTVERYSYTVTQMNIEKLFKAIILSDIGGRENYCDLAESIFLIDHNKDAIFFLYDDRGVDVYSKDQAYLKQLCISCKQHFLEPK